MPHKTKEARNAWHRKWRKANAEHVKKWNKDNYAKNPRRQISATIKYKYGITYEDYERMLAEQGGCCAICGSPDSGGRGRFHIDHDHSCCPTQKTCGKCVRGLLCHLCNTRLHLIEEGWASKAIDYLQRWV
jgi:hypothetical protein